MVHLVDTHGQSEVEDHVLTWRHLNVVVTCTYRGPKTEQVNASQTRRWWRTTVVSWSRPVPVVMKAKLRLTRAVSYLPTEKLVFQSPQEPSHLITAHEMW